jgi:signal transduction histidine kinase
MWMYLLPFAVACEVIAVRRTRMADRGPGRPPGWLRRLTAGPMILPVALLFILVTGATGIGAVLVVLLAGTAAVLTPPAARWVMPLWVILLGAWGVTRVLRTIQQTLHGGIFRYVLSLPTRFQTAAGRLKSVTIRALPGPAGARVGVVQTKPGSPIVYGKAPAPPAPPPPPGGSGTVLQVVPPGSGQVAHAVRVAAPSPSAKPVFQVAQWTTWTPMHFSWTAEAWLLAALAALLGGGWLLFRGISATPGLTAKLMGPRWQPAGRGWRRRPWPLLLVPVAALYAELLLNPDWLNGRGGVLLAAVLAGALATLVVIRRLPRVAADLAVAGLLLFAVYSVVIALRWPGYGFPRYGTLLAGAVYVASPAAAWLAGVQGLALGVLALWLFPRAVDPRTRSLIWPTASTQAELSGQVQRLARSRAEVVDSAAAELRRVERDLHDGAQARLVAVGISLRTAQKIIFTSPEAASQLLAEAISSSSQALTELRNLVRGIHPPVLADRGLPDAIRALALDCPLHTVTDIDLDGRPDLPVESACYFAVAEVLANAVKHAGARHVQIRARHDGGVLRIEVTDDGSGGADPARGTGLIGLERRLASFDGILAVSSPPGGPTMIVIEVPCALSWPKTYSC